ncbi:MAG: (Fe-S)-binding protein [Anaerolineae bacterium]|nr:(Fe-S)-binding protein [Anaerolineae bacterium]
MAQSSSHHSAKPAEKPKSVQLFVTCMIEAIRPEVGMAVVRVLKRLGVQIEFPTDQTCCGQPAFNAGAVPDARAMARHTLDVLSRSASPIVTPSGSCADMLVHQYPALLAGDAHYGPLAEQIAARTYEFSQFLVDVLGVTEADLAQTQGHESVTYHPSCHLSRGLKVTEAPSQLLAATGVETHALNGANECCGFGGLFAVKMSDISGAMLNRKLDNIEASGAKIVVGCDVSCLLHMGGGLHRRGSAITTKHIAEIIS